MPQRLEQGLPLPVLFGQKADEQEPLAVEPRKHQRRQRSIGPGDHRIGQLLFPAQPHQFRARIRDAGHSRIRDIGNIFARAQLFDQAAARLALVELVHGNERLKDAEVIEQRQGMPRILTGDFVHALQRLHRSVGHILEIADGRRHQVQRSVHPLPRSLSVRSVLAPFCSL